MIKNLKDLQSNMKVMQDKMQNITSTGTAGGDMVKITMNGQMEVTAVELSPEVVDPSDIGMLQDLIRAAHANAMANIKEKIKDEMSAMGGPLPPEFTGF